ncbi:ABC transporter G family member 10 [Vitis vinifera]|uniref:ABC transporter G family member 10 n=1 Tax=Vitis vinifera TaxID=29760 RepID=A0A438JKJ1_VITVI|nr:ABC transporter G family member 10 [Vitis vinifera]
MNTVIFQASSVPPVKCLPRVRWKTLHKHELPIPHLAIDSSLESKFLNQSFLNLLLIEIEENNPSKISIAAGWRVQRGRVWCVSSSSPPCCSSHHPYFCLMELPVKAPAGSCKVQYRIRTKELTYRLSRGYDELNCFGSWDEPNHVPRYILKNVNCEARPGEITAIAGPSGAGKTTLLEILAGVVRPSRVSGQILVNDQPMDATCFRRVSGYVTQEDALFPLLTIEETLMYSARLRLRGGRDRAAARVKELLKELELEHVAGARIGDESSRGISGGLDSASAHHVVLLLKSMATNQVVLLSNGTVLHHGPLHLLEHRLKIAGHCIPQHVNVLEFAIDDTESLVTDMEENKPVNGEIEQGFGHINELPNLSNVDESRICYPNSHFEEVLILGQRFSRNIFRTKQLFTARTTQAVLAGFVLGTIFKNEANDPSKFKLHTQIGFFAFSLTFLLSSTTEGLPIFLQERRILMRETSRGAYRVSSYVVANTLIFLPFLLTVALLYTTPVYWLVGLRREIDGFLYFSLVVWIIVLMSNSFIACFSALVPNFIIGTSLIAGLMGSFFLFSGYFISKEDIPRYWIFMHYLSLFKYPFECFMINEYGGKKGKCLESVEGECILYGDGFLLQQGLKESQKWSNLGPIDIQVRRSSSIKLK